MTWPRFARWTKAALVVAACGLSAAPARGVFVAAPFAGSYTATDLGTVAGVPGSFGGLTFLDPNTLLLAGNANLSTGAIFRVPVVRNASGQVTGFGAPTVFASAPNIDGGLAFGPGGVLFYTAFPNNTVGQIEPGSVVPDRVIDLTPLGVGSSVGSLGFVPAGFPGAGNFVIMSYTASQSFTATLTPDGMGTFTIGGLVAGPTFPGNPGPEGFAYVPPGSALFPNPGVLVAEFNNGVVAAYDVGPNGLSIPGTRRLFLGDLTGAEGAVVDPVTGDILFSTFGGNRIVRVSGFAAPAAVPAPPAVVLALVGGATLIGGRRLRRRAA